jgi:tricorn protease-like protein
VGELDADEPLPSEFFQRPTDWSRDGRFVAWTNVSFAQMQNERRGEVWLTDMVRKRAFRLSGTSNHESEPAFSPDGRWLAFTSDESGNAEVYVQALEGGETPRLVGERYLVSRNGAICLQWRRDGKELFYLAEDGRLYAVPITLSTKLNAGEAVPLFTIDTQARAALHSPNSFSVSPDGQRFLVPIVTSSEKSEIVVIHNWEAAVQPQTVKVN